MKNVPNMHDRQVENLLKLPPKDRLDYFVRYCADFEQVWGLVVGEDNWVLFKDEQGDEIFPIWSHPKLAETCCFEEHRVLNAKPQAMVLNSFLENCIPDMISNNVLFGVFYDKNRTGLSISGENLKIAIEDEIKSVWE
jgi:hypothetical protein